LVEHARALATAHGKPTHSARPGLVAQRFQETREDLKDAYAALAREVRAIREPTPAEEWLLDNSHIVEDQLREVSVDLPRGYLAKLPRLAGGALAGAPRVYAICLDVLRHSDARVDPEVLIAYVEAYQSVAPLTIGELWAVPIMLRIGLLMMVATAAGSAIGDRSTSEARAFAEQLGAAADVASLLAKRSVQTLTPSFLVELRRAILERETDTGLVLDWIAQRAHALGTSTEELSRLHHLRRAEEQLTVGNAITSMRAISAYDWAKFFTRTSRVEAVLASDPAGAYALSEAATRDRVRHAVERMARHNRLDEEEVARAAVRLCERVPQAEGTRLATRHVGFYLLDKGRPELERELDAHPPIRDALTRFVERHAHALYFGCIGLGTLLLVASLSEQLGSLGLSPWLVATLLALLGIAMSEVASGLTNSLVMAVMPPRILSKLDFKRGIPREHATLVAVPALLDDSETVARLLEDLEVRALANMEDHLSFALLTDFGDAAEETRPEDAPLLEQVTRGIKLLNERHPRAQGSRFWLLHRRRVFNASEDRFMGWERKRGKLEELNRLLLGHGETTYSVVTAPEQELRAVRYVITLDADTELPRGTARKLVATLAHPLNRPHFDPAQGRVVEGYGLLQPRVGVVPMTSRRSRLARLHAGSPGIDPYTTAVSDVYQDLFGEGSFVGKGIYDVQAFHRALDGRVAENTLLSHDLFEGLFARTALTSDIEVLDDQPASYEVETRRQHRWIRGDFQLLPWFLGLMGPRARLPWNAYWKVFDNLRRALLAPSLLLAVWTSVSVAPRAMPWVVGAILLVVMSPVFVRLCANLVRKHETGTLRWPLVWGDLRTNVARCFVSLTFLLDTAILHTDAILRTLYRMSISRKNLLQWTSTGQAERLLREKGVRIDLRLLVGALFALLTLCVAVVQSQAVALSLLPLCTLWALSPVASRWLSQDLPLRQAELALSERYRVYARRVARKTWRFFETFVSAQDNWLPPDNFQEDPRGVLAHRTSPTNIGLYLVSCLSARDLGYLTLVEWLDRISATLDSMERLETYRGHLLNWYDTSTLQPLAPKYVSMVDSGNLLGHLWVLRQGCLELTEARFEVRPCLQAIEDALVLASESDPKRAPLLETIRHLQIEARPGIDFALTTLRAVLDGLPTVSDLEREDSEASYWLSEARATAESFLQEYRSFAPFLATLASASPVLRADAEFAAAALLLRMTQSLDELLLCSKKVLPLLASLTLRHPGSALLLDRLAEEVRGAALRAENVRSRLWREAARAGALADRMDFTFMYDEDRSLFSIGYNVDLGQLDSSRYDLLASEARLGSFVAIAKGDVPEEHWFHLSRARVRTEGRASLVAWSGSMFEYLMPLLVMRRSPATLLDETYSSVVLAQRAYAEGLGLPWGVSESAYNVMDLHMTYQYRAFGVQSLGLKAGLADDRVVAPYATALSAMIYPDLSMQNLQRLAKEGLEGPCGFYEAVDYTPERVPPGRQCVVVKAYMAHHQGMVLVSLANLLLDFPMQRRFHADMRVKATELLLEERAPRGVPVMPERVIQSSNQILSDAELSHVDRVTLDDAPLRRCHLLGHGELATVITSRGIGFTSWRKLDVHRFRDDADVGGSGVFLYIRNRKTGAFWSAGFEPTRRAADEYFAEFSPDKVRLQRRDGDVESILEIVVSPEYPAELRRLTLFNRGTETMELDVTSYMEVVLAPRAADLAHRSFSNLFVHTEALPQKGCVLATRRPRKAGEFQPFCLQVLRVEDASPEARFELETSRGLFLGRGGSYHDPDALTGNAPLSGTVGFVLDPVIALRQALQLKPGQHVRICLTTALADSRQGVLNVVDALSASSGVTRTFELAWADARVELKHLGVSGLVSHRFQRLLSALLFPEPGLRGSAAAPDVASGGLRALWSLGISGDLPILLVRLDDLELTDLVRDVLLAHEFFRVNNVQVDLLLWNEEMDGYLSPQHDKALQLIHATAGHGRLDQPGGVFLRHASKVSEAERILILAYARVVLQVSQGSLARQLKQERPRRIAEALLSSSAPDARPARRVQPALQFDNGIGGFTADGREYVMQVSETARPPAPWSNVMAQPSFGTLVTESGGGFTWAGNSQRYRLTPWSNDAVLDPVAEVVYLRDDATRAVWSATPSPAPRGAEYTVRHGQGYTTFERHADGIASELTQFLHPHEPAKVYRITIRNDSEQVRSLSVVMFVDLSVGATRDRARHTVWTRYEADVRALLSGNPFSAYPERCCFLASTAEVTSFTTDRDEIVGELGSAERPDGLTQAALSGASGRSASPCAALHITLTLKPFEALPVVFTLGDAANVAEARAAAQRHRAEANWQDLLVRAKASWDEILDKVVIKTPDAALDIMVNRWLLYQTLSCRIWGRSGFYQSGGAYGYRDQLQDVLALLHTRPDVAREHLLRAAERQFVEGDVQHWWHPDTGEGVRTHCSDDMLWLPFAVARYVEVTGDSDVLDAELAFLEERALTLTDHDLYSVPRVARETASLYEHCRRALLVGTTAGPRGIPLMRGGDWNDGMDQVGAAGRGESIWLGWFVARVWRDFAVLAKQRGDGETCERAQRESTRIAHAIETHGWDGAWYRRAYADDDSALGSADSPECKIDAIAQAWAELSGVGDERRAHQAVASSLSQLVRRDEAMMMLLTPPFTGESSADPGYIRAYPAGIRENGGQYTHGVLWTVQALLSQGECERAEELLAMLNPIRHGSAPEEVARYRLEPYVVAADVYASAEHMGRGGWSWYTGAAGWMYRIAVEDMLGLQVRGDVLHLRPRVPRDWSAYSLRYRRGQTVWAISYSNPQRLALKSSELRVRLDGKEAASGRISLVEDGKVHAIEIVVAARATEQVASSS
jgi:cellobiose phosphorylase